jgi:hypothetical protein
VTWYLTTPELVRQGWTTSMIALLGKPDAIRRSKDSPKSHAHAWRLMRVAEVMHTPRWNGLAERVIAKKVRSYRR